MPSCRLQAKFLVVSLLPLALFNIEPVESHPAHRAFMMSPSNHVEMSPSNHVQKAHRACRDEPVEPSHPAHRACRDEPVESCRIMSR